LKTAVHQLLWIGLLLVWNLHLHAGEAAASTLSSSSQTTNRTNAYLRTLHQPDGTILLQTCARQLQSTNFHLPTLWLVSVVHIGTTNYYHQLQKFLDQQDLVLYEGVGDVPKNSSSPTGFSLQRELAKALGLAFQLDAIQYDRTYFENCDLTLNQLLALFRFSGKAPEKKAKVSSSPASSSGEAQTAFQQLLDILNGVGFWGNLAKTLLQWIHTHPSAQAVLKYALAELFGNLPDDLTAIRRFDPAWGAVMEVILEKRNEVVLRRVQQLARSNKDETAGSSCAIAIFYGAGHMPLLEQALRQNLHYHVTQQKWFTVFTVNPKKAGISPAQLALFQKILQMQIRMLHQAVQ